MPSAADSVRRHLVAALEADLVGPFVGEPEGGPPAQELLSLPPSRWYLTGFLAPEGSRDPQDPTQEEELGAGSDETEEETAGDEPEPKQKRWLPASIGLSVLLPPGEAADSVTVTVRWADYRRERSEEVGEGAGAEDEPRDEPEPEKGRSRERREERWRRIVRPRQQVDLRLDQKALLAGTEVPGSGGLRLIGLLREQAEFPGLLAGTRALTVFLVNRRPTAARGRQDESYAFQVCLELEAPMGIVPRPNVSGEHSREWDDRIADLQFRETYEYAVGHGISVEVPDQERPVRRVRTAWLPRAVVRPVVTREEAAVETRMEALAELADGEAAEAVLAPLVEAYGRWIGKQRAVDVGGQPRRETQAALMDRAERARQRIADGIRVLATDPEALTAFQLANEAMAMAARQRNPERYADGKVPRWHLFQLAFVLLNLPGLVDETREDRETVELVYFPTGGGKTEAYLGVIAFTLLLRRLRGRSRPDQGLGVAVLLRYTLRLLTLDQLGRAATLVCALELIRRRPSAELGTVRFSVGLWVGRTATANTLEQVKAKIIQYRNNPSPNAPSPLPLTNCPWCREPLGRNSLVLSPDTVHPREVIVGCLDHRCPFSTGKNVEGLPILFVDEQVYREAPSFLVGTVDKFAMLPWRGETGMLFGRVRGRVGRVFLGPLDKVKKDAQNLPEGLRPPELIVQDELHLISGPLGTLVGLYETAVERLCARVLPDGRRVIPKILASTATVRRAAHQVQALFARHDVAVFPPPGIDDSETYFGTVDHRKPGREYLGVAASGRAIKAILLRCYISLLAAGEARYDPKGPPDQQADGYTTLAGYFNSLRELGGMRRLVEDEVRTRVAKAEERKPVDFQGPHPWYRNRPVQAEPVELTSRETTHRIAAARARLAKEYPDKQHVDVLLASNMISVGIDIDRLALMVIAGQPKTTSEYIQASSRVGRAEQWPGLVVTCFNVHKPRDRSHYERFTAYHQSFYRFVEATSLTPFSGPALERGLAGALLSIARLLDPALTPAEAVMEIALHRAVGEEGARALSARSSRQPGLSAAEQQRIEARILDRCQNLLDALERIAEEAKEQAAKWCYSPFDIGRAGKPILHTVLDENRPFAGTDHAKFAAPTSMRDVEPNVHFWLNRGTLGRRR